MQIPLYYEILFAAFAFILGAAIGSFLNVCIYRMPLGLSVNEPKRSFCPTCKYQIPWYRNLPLISWLSLRGKCANCGSKISVRYFGVELLTGLLFLAIWWRVWMHPRPEMHYQGWVLALPYWILVSLLVVATFIDFEHFIIPDEVTIGGTVAGVLFSFAIPLLHGQSSNLMGAVWGLVGAGVGFGALWSVVQLGKLAFGKKSFAQKEPASFTWIRRPAVDDKGEICEGSDADLVVGDIAWKSAPKLPLLESIWLQIKRLLVLLKLRKSDEVERGEKWIWSEIFGRDSDVLTMKCRSVNIDGQELGEVALSFTCNILTVGKRTWELEKVDRIEGVVVSLIVPREAMGFGDVKFIAAIGAFLGWKAVGFTVMSGSSIGAVVGLLSIAVGRREFSAKIPFGPYLALGALIWIFSGPEIVRWYLEMIAPAPGM